MQPGQLRIYSAASLFSVERIVFRITFRLNLGYLPDQKCSFGWYTNHGYLEPVTEITLVKSDIPLSALQTALVGAALFGKKSNWWQSFGSHLPHRYLCGNRACQGRIGLGEHKRYDKEESQHSPFVGTSVKYIGGLWGSSLPFWSKSLVQVARVRWGRKGAGVLGVAWLRPTHSLSPSIACTERPASPSELKCSDAASTSQPESPSAPTEPIQQVDSVLGNWNKKSKTSEVQLPLLRIPCAGNSGEKAHSIKCDAI